MTESLKAAIANAKAKAAAVKKPKVKPKARAARVMPATRSGSSATPSRIAKPPAIPRQATPARQVVEYPCLCGCGDTTDRFFRRGHVARYVRYLQLARELRADQTPADVMPKTLFDMLGPWKKLSRGGWVPTVKNYTKLRTEVKP